MKKDRKEDKKIPAKNYYIVLIVSILVIVLTLYVRSFYLNYSNANAGSSVFEDKSINQLNIDDIDYAVNETTEGILFISYNGDTTINMMEKRLYREVESKNLNDNFLYLNITENKENALNTLKSKYPEFARDMNTAPMIIYIKDGSFVEVVDSSDELVTYKTLNTLLSKYEID